MKEKQRLSKVMAQAGVASRRSCEEIIFAGRVTINGEEALVPQTMVADEDKICVDGKTLSGIEPKAYYLLNKPVGYVCANFDRHYKKVKDLFNSINLRLFTVGRLDKETSGLLIVTNDGHFAQRVIHPSAGIEKEYLAQVDRPITKNDLNIISKGVDVEGTFVKPKLVKQCGKDRVTVVVMEGKKREVRCLLNNAGLNVVRLKRTRIGGLSLDRKLKEGQWRPLTKDEQKQIFSRR